VFKAFPDKRSKTDTNISRQENILLTKTLRQYCFFLPGFGKKTARAKVDQGRMRALTGITPG
jgi:hypothetical protein